LPAAARLVLAAAESLVTSHRDGYVAYMDTDSIMVSPIISYKVIQWETGSNVFTTFPNLGTSTQAFATGLKNNVSYNFRVTAINSEGTGKESNSVSAIPKSATAPKYTIPQWIKTNAGWWSQGLISDSEYVQAIEYMINQGIIKIK
jgi:hypothetical protein